MTHCRHLHRTSNLVGIALGVLGLAVGCGGGSSGSGTGGTGGYDGPSFGVDAAGIGEAACSNGLDDDGDNQVDYNDPECIGPLDDDESSFATGIPGDNSDPCRQDCFFDGNSGSGDDGCLWQLKCDPASPGAGAGCPYDQSYVDTHANECSVSSSQSTQCLNYCKELTPNGCDCFGCCFIPELNVSLTLMATCTAADFDDPTKCPRCTQVTSCSNPCGTCEYCIGKDTLPPECNVPTPGQCPSGITACGDPAPSGGVLPAGCPTDTACTSGCCLPRQCPVGVTACGDPAPAGGVLPLNCPPTAEGRSTGCVTGCCIPLVE